MDSSDNRLDQLHISNIVSLDFCADCSQKEQPCYYLWGCKDCLVCKVQKIRTIKKGGG